jgi:hypothetical protein
MGRFVLYWDDLHGPAGAGRQVAVSTQFGSTSAGMQVEPVGHRGGLQGIGYGCRSTGSGVYSVRIYRCCTAFK